VVGVQDDNCGLPGRIQAVKNGRAQGHSCVGLASIGGMNIIFDFSRSSLSADCGGRLFLLTNTPFHLSGGVNMTEITIYTDGSCQTQTRIGGWAAVLRCSARSATGKIRNSIEDLQTVRKIRPANASPA